MAWTMTKGAASKEAAPRLVSVLPPGGNTRTSVKPESAGAASPELLQGYQGTQKPYLPRSVRACQEGAWSLALLNLSTGEVMSRPFRCKSWRCERCAPFVNRLEHDRIQSGLEIAQRGALSFLTLTFDRKRYGSAKDAWRGSKDAWKRLRDRLSYHYGERGRGGARAKVRYIQTWEQHRNGWPHMHALVECAPMMDDLVRLGFYEREQNGKKVKIYRWTRKILRPMLLASGFGPIAHTEPPDNLEGAAGYLVKLAAELTGSHHKQEQTPIRAPRGFRRLRATPGFLPPRKTRQEWTGKLERCKNETLEKAISDGRYNWSSKNGEDSEMQRVRGDVRPSRSTPTPQIRPRGGNRDEDGAGSYVATEGTDLRQESQA